MKKKSRDPDLLIHSIQYSHLLLYPRFTTLVGVLGCRRLLSGQIRITQLARICPLKGCKIFNIPY
jgi:hypothetical protein